MRSKTLLLSALLLSGCVVVSNVALSRSRAPEGYFWGDDNCLHRFPQAVLQGLPAKRKVCEPPPPPREGKVQNPTPPVFVIATPSQVIAALECDFSAAARETKGRRLDLSRAVISGKLTFSLVRKDTKGISLTVQAIPVFAAGTAAPSLEASRLTDTTSSTQYQFNVDPAALIACADPSSNNWLTSTMMSDLLQGGGITITQHNTELQFVLTRKNTAGLKLNIVPVSIGPQIEGQTVNTQKLELTFSWKPATSAPAPKAAVK